MFSCGLRRAEAIAVQVADCDPESGAIRVVGKGNRERQVYATNGGKRALDAWIAIRGPESGPILCPVRKGANGRPRTGAGMTAPALVKRLARRATQAGIGQCSPHDLRRSFVSAALEGGADIAMDRRTKVIHTVAVTAANVHDATCLGQLLHGEETEVWGDSAYSVSGPSRVSRPHGEG